VNLADELALAAKAAQPKKAQPAPVDPLEENRIYMRKYRLDHAERINAHRRKKYAKQRAG
jgi:hypothetical protein